MTKDQYFQAATAIVAAIIANPLYGVISKNEKGQIIFLDDAKETDAMKAVNSALHLVSRTARGSADQDEKWEAEHKETAE